MALFPEYGPFDGEGFKPWGAFCAFVEMPPDRRSLRGLALRLGHPESYRRQLLRWAQVFAWRERAAILDVRRGWVIVEASGMELPPDVAVGLVGRAVPKPET